MAIKSKLTEMDILNYQNQGLLVWETEGKNGHYEIHVINVNNKDVFTDIDDFKYFIKNKLYKK